MIELHCDWCGKLLGFIVDCGPRGMCACFECNEKEESEDDYEQ